MILRRMAEHVKAQNWTAVGLDFMIVVFGVFAGLQVNNWNEARHARMRESNYLALLKNDVSTMRSLMDDYIVSADGREEAMLRVLRSLETCSPELATKSDFERTFTEYQNILNIQVLDATYNEMLASGALAGITDVAQKRAIAELFTQLNTNIWTIVQIRATLPTVDAIVWRHVRLSYADDGQATLAEYNFDALCSEPSVQNAVVEMIDMQRDWKSITGQAGVRIADMEERLKGVAEMSAEGDAR